MDATDHLDVIPKVLKWHTFTFIKVSLQVRHSTAGVDNAPFFIESLHPCFAESPSSLNTFPVINRISFFLSSRPGDVRFVIASASLFFYMPIPSFSSAGWQRCKLHVQRLRL